LFTRSLFLFLDFLHCK